MKYSVIILTACVLFFTHAPVGFTQDAMQYKPGQKKDDKSDQTQTQNKTDKKAEKQTSKAQQKSGEKAEKPKKKGGFFSRIGRIFGGGSKKKKDNTSPDMPKVTVAEGQKRLTPEQIAKGKQLKAEQQAQKEKQEPSKEEKRRLKAQRRAEAKAAKEKEKKDKALKKKQDEIEKARAEIEAFIKSMGPSPEEKKLASQYGKIKGNIEKLLKYFNKAHPYYPGLVLNRARGAAAARDRKNYQAHWQEALDILKPRIEQGAYYDLLTEATDKAADMGMKKEADYFGDLAGRYAGRLFSGGADKEIFMQKTRKLRGLAKTMTWADMKDSLDEYMFHAKRTFTMADKERLEAIYTDCNFWLTYAPKKIENKRLIMSKKLMDLKLAYGLHQEALGYRERQRFEQLIDGITTAFAL